MHVQSFEHNVNISEMPSVQGKFYDETYEY